jgi:hypothetical protein
MTDCLSVIFDEVSKYFYEDSGKYIKLTRITSVALTAWHETWHPININISTRKPPNGGWDWKVKVKHFEKNYRKYMFDVAIWDKNGNLCGLALGKKSRMKGNLSIYFLEAVPSESNPLKGYIFSIINLVGSEYAKFNYIKKFRLIEPVNGLLAFYQRFGFQLKSKTLFGKTYCEKEILL